MLYFERGSVADKLSLDDLRKGLSHALDRLGPRKRVLVVPPDFTRFHSHAGRADASSLMIITARI